MNKQSVLGEYIKAFKKYLEFRNKSPRTIKEYGYDLGMFDRFLIEAGYNSTISKITDIDEIIIEDFLLYLKNQKTNQRGEPLSPVTINRKYFSLRAFFDFLIKRRIYKKENPMQYIDLLNTPTLSTHTYLSVSQARQLLDNIDTAYPKRDKLMIELMLLLGLRVSEVAALNVSDIDFYNDTITIHGKGDKERVIPISPQIKKSLKEFLKLREEKFPDVSDNALFISRNRRRISVRQIQLTFEKIVGKLGFNDGKEDEPSRRKITCHKLRHTFGTLSVQDGTDILVLKEILGHSSINTTQIYAKAADKQIRDAVINNPIYNES